MTDSNLNLDRRLPVLPDTVPWGLRKICQSVRQFRGYGRVLPALASIAPSLQEVCVESFFCGPMYLDFRELICLPIFVHGYYKHQFPEDLVLNRLLCAGMNVFDIGANIGYYTAFFSLRVKSHGRVVSVEPMPRALRLLKKNAQLCGSN